MSNILSIVLTVLFIMFPAQIKDGAKTGIENGIFILLPSIFPYIAISQIFIKTGGADYVSKIIYKYVKKLFHYSEANSSAYLLSLFCGYPTGARMADEIEAHSPKEALRLFLFGNIPGFGFCVSFLGSLLGNTLEGVKIYLSFLLSSLILNYISSFVYKEENAVKTKKDYLPFSKAVTVSIKESSIVIVEIIGYSVFFSGLSEIFSLIIKNDLFISVLKAFFEITSGIPKIAKISLNPYILIFFTGFSGLSVIFQSLSFKKSNVSVILIFITRLLFALTAMYVYYIF